MVHPKQTGAYLLAHVLQAKARVAEFQADYERGKHPGPVIGCPSICGLIGDVLATTCCSRLMLRNAHSGRAACLIEQHTYTHSKFTMCVALWWLVPVHRGATVGHLALDRNTVVAALSMVTYFRLL